MFRLMISTIALLGATAGFSQQTITLAFTAIDSVAYVQLDSIKVMNRTKGGDTTLFWNDTVLVLNVPVGLPGINSRNSGFKVRGVPNPVTDKATIEVVLPSSGETVLTVTDVLGRSLCVHERDLQAGSHTFQFVPNNDPLYFITATWNGYRKSIKVVNSRRTKGLQCTISYQGHGSVVAQEKAAEAIQDFSFEQGDELMYIGYIDTLESGVLDKPDTSETYVFQFAFNIPCTGTPTVTYEGQVYNTVQIFGQCWLKENLNVGTMISGDSNMEDNGVKEKYCYNNEPDSCDKYGGLYQWDEMMQYTTQQGVQGICPTGWHIPTDEEWKVLEGAADSQFGIGDPEWDGFGANGHDAGLNLKSILGWLNNGNGSAITGFNALPAGSSNSGSYGGLNENARFWASSYYSFYTYYPWMRGFNYAENKSVRNYNSHFIGNSVRCVKD